MENFNHLRIPLEIIKHATKDFDEANFIAEGGFGKVYRGDFSTSEGQLVGAVKRFHHRSNNGEAYASFGTEILLLSKYTHKNLISLIGFYNDKKEQIIVYEYASNGSLDYHLHNTTLTWIQRLKICLGAACGLQYLHDAKGTQQRVLHRDIKSGNILLDENWNAKIADFGLSKYGPANQENSFQFSSPVGTLGYCDPTYATKWLLTKETDVYSFGVVMCEVMCSRNCNDNRYTDELPILVKKCCEEQKLFTIINDNLLQQMEEESLFTFVKVAYQCLADDRTQRPLMDVVVRELETALKYQEVKESERRNMNSVSQKQEVAMIKSKSQVEEREKKVLQRVADYEVGIQEPKIRKVYPQNNIINIGENSHQQRQVEPEELSSRWSLKSLETNYNNVNSLLNYEKICPPGESNSVILYTTQLNLIPKTFKDCSNTISLLESYKIAYEERDLSIHYGFREELRQMLGRNVDLPRLFIKGRYIGGGADVLRLNEQGRFRPLLAGIPRNITKEPCKGCAGFRFVICGNCKGCQKVDSDEGVLLAKCMECNENGLIKCPICNNCN